MVGELKDLPPSAKTRVPQQAINKAATDGEIQKEEYTAIRQHAEKFGFDLSELNEMNTRSAFQQGLRPPPLLQQKYEQRRNELERPIS